MDDNQALDIVLKQFLQTQDFSQIKEDIDTIYRAKGWIPQNKKDDRCPKCGAEYPDIIPKCDMGCDEVLALSEIEKSKGVRKEEQSELCKNCGHEKEFHFGQFSEIGRCVYGMRIGDKGIIKEGCDCRKFEPLAESVPEDVCKSREKSESEPQEEWQ